jgi:signal peptidase II
VSISRSSRIFWGAAISVVVIDQVTKWLAEANLIRHVPHRVIGDWVRFTLAYNPGAAFSMSVGEYSRYVFGAFAIVALVILWRIQRTSAPGEVLKPLALGLAWGGAAGNLVDRFRSELGVVDFIDIGIGGTRFWTFNVADSAVSVGAVVLGILLMREEREEKRRRENQPPPPSVSEQPGG